MHRLLLSLTKTNLFCRVGQTRSTPSLFAFFKVFCYFTNAAFSLELNASMRRIDLLCKLAGPLFIALIDGASTTIAIWIILALNAVSFLIEYLAIARVSH